MLPEAARLVTCQLLRSQLLLFLAEAAHLLSTLKMFRTDFKPPQTHQRPISIGSFLL
jgi:hypothetical protein